MRKFSHLPAIFLLLALSLPATVSATMYAYLDAQGIRHYKDVKVVQSIGRSPIIASQPDSPAFRSIHSRGPGVARVEPQELDGYIKAAAKDHKVDPMLIRAVIKAESNFDTNAVSPKGAQGLMQLMPGTARYLSVANPFDPLQNINGGTKYLRQLLDSYNDDVRLSLAAYNAGPGKVTQQGMTSYISDTQAYVAKVLEHYNAYHNQD